MKKQMIRVLRYYKEYLKAKKNNAEKIVIIKSRKKYEIISNRYSNDPKPIGSKIKIKYNVYSLNLGGTI